jgi:hypothetical protein
MSWEGILKLTARFMDANVKARYDEIQEQMRYVPNKQVQNDFNYEIMTMYENNNGYPLTMQQVENARIKVSKSRYSRIEKGAMDKIKALIKKLKDASFKRKLKKFLKNNLTVGYKFQGWDGPYQVYSRTTPRQESLDEAKEILLQLVEEAWDETFPEEYGLDMTPTGE